MTTYAVELEAALAAAAVAGDYIRAEYETFVPIPNAPATISTHVDKQSQEIILQYLHARFPADGLCGEETTASLPTGTAAESRVWVIDPIDGTRGFAMKNGEFSVMIGLRIGNEIVVGVVLEPTLMRYTYATQGGGCFTRTGDGEITPCRVTATAAVEKCVLVQSHHRRRMTLGTPEAAIRPAAVKEMYSAGVKLAVVARGEGDVYVNTYPNFHDWDICAGHILVTEAGGTVTGLRGGEITYADPDYVQRIGLVASNGAIHADVIDRVAAVVLR